MKPIWIPALALTVAVAATGCKSRKEEPVPAPNAGGWSAKAAIRVPAIPLRPSAPALRVQTQELLQNAPEGDHYRHMPHGANGISWFQGSFEEAFSIACSCHCYQFGLKN